MFSPTSRTRKQKSHPRRCSRPWPHVEFRPGPGCACFLSSLKFRFSASRCDSIYIYALQFVFWKTLEGQMTMLTVSEGGVSPTISILSGLGFWASVINQNEALIDCLSTFMPILLLSFDGDPHLALLAFQ